MKDAGRVDVRIKEGLDEGWRKDGGRMEEGWILIFLHISVLS